MLLGTSLGILLAFNWTYLSEYFTSKTAFILVSILTLICCFILFRLALKYGAESLEVIFKNIVYKLTTSKGKDKLDIADDVRSIVSLYTLRSVLLLTITIIASILGGILLVQQNKYISDQNSLITKQNSLIENQNNRLDVQNNLLESERRSALSTTYNSITQKVYDELMSSDNSKRNLSRGTIANIIAYSQILKPYKQLENNNLYWEELSPERAQMLVFLLENNLSKETYNEIYNSANFTYSDLRNSNLSGKYLKNINLSYSNLINANLNSADLSNSKLTNCNFIKTSLIDVDLTKSDICYSKFYGARIRDKWLENFSHKHYSDLMMGRFKSECYFFLGERYQYEDRVTQIVDSNNVYKYIKPKACFSNQERQDLFLSACNYRRTINKFLDDLNYYVTVNSTTTYNIELSGKVNCEGHIYNLETKDKSVNQSSAEAIQAITYYLNDFYPVKNENGTSVDALVNITLSFSNGNIVGFKFKGDCKLD